MKKLLILIIFLGIIWPFDLMAQEAKIFEPAPAPLNDPIILTRADIANILNIAIMDIEKQGCEPMFLNSNPSLIWCKCKTKDGKQIIRVYELEPVIKIYLQRKEVKQDDTIDRRQQPKDDRGGRPEAGSEMYEKDK